MYNNAAVTANNWSGGIQPKYPAVWPANSFKSDSMFTVSPITMQTATDAFASVLAGVGATLPGRDSVDSRIVREVTNGTSTYGTGGIINSQTDVGGWPAYNSLPAPADADHDGMPDAWELAHGLNPNDPADRNSIASSGYTMLEEYLNSIQGQTGITAADNRTMHPTLFELFQNYPNPFNPSTTISFSLPTRSFVSLKIFDALGREVSTIVSKEMTAGKYSRQWNASDLPGGVYFYRLQAGSLSETKKLLLLR